MALFLFSVVVALHQVRICPGWQGELYTTVLCPQAQYKFFSFSTTCHIIGALVPNMRAVAERSDFLEKNKIRLAGAYIISATRRYPANGHGHGDAFRHIVSTTVLSEDVDQLGITT